MLLVNSDDSTNCGVSATLAEMRVRVTGDSNQNPEEGAVAPVAEESTAPMTTQSRQGAVCSRL